MKVLVIDALISISTVWSEAIPVDLQVWHHHPHH